MSPVKYFLPVQNFRIVKEKLEPYRSFPTEDEIKNFLQFYDEAYQIWLKNSPTIINKENLEHKIKIRKLLNKLG